MKYLLMFLLFLSAPAFAEETMPVSQLPPLHVALLRDFSKWKVYDEAFGDLNGDGVKDAAAVLMLEPKDEEDSGSALLAVLFGEGKDFKLHAQSGGAICMNCGGAKAPQDTPLGKIAITDKGILTISYFGGSRTIFDVTTKWRYDKGYNRITLIGETRIITDTMGEYDTETFDINYATMKMEKRVGKQKKSCAVPKEMANQEISGFDYIGRDDAIEKLEKACE